MVWVPLHLCGWNIGATWVELVFSVRGTTENSLLVSGVLDSAHRQRDIVPDVGCWTSVNRLGYGFHSCLMHGCIF